MHPRSHLSSLQKLSGSQKPVAILALLACHALAQTGIVRSGGQPIPGATVTATENGQTVSTTTGPDGRYALPAIGAGKGTIAIEMFGFEPQNKGAALGESATSIDFNLQLRTSDSARRIAQFAARAGARNTDTTDPTLQAELANAGTQTTSTPAAAASQGSNEAFLVQGSLSQGLNPNAPPDFAQNAEFDPRGLNAPGGQGAPGFSTGGQAGPGGGGGFGGGGFGGGGGGFGGGGGRGGAGGGGRGPGQHGPGQAQFGNRRRRQSIRGLVFFTLNNSALNAKPFSINGADVPQAAYAQSRFGFVAGGPLVIPHIVHDSNTFFSLSYFGTRAKNPSIDFSTVPTALERMGDFSQAIQSGGASGTTLPVVLYNPGTKTPFANNIIPRSLLSPVALKLLNYYPLPNLSGDVNNYEYDTSTVSNTDNLNARIQRNTTKNDRLAYHITYQDRSGQNLQPFGYTDTNSGYGISTDLTWTRNFSPTLINNLRVNFNRNRSETTPFFANGPNVAAEVGIAGTSTNPANYGPPNLNFTNFASLTDSAPVLTRNQSQGTTESVIWVRGKHSFNFGFIYARNDLSTITDQNGRGTFNFTGEATSAISANGLAVSGTGYDFADFLLGLPQSSSIRFGEPATYFSQNAFSGYVNDDWKFNANLTFNIGLRYEYFSPISEKYNQIANLDIAPGFTNVAVVTPTIPGPYTGAFPSGLVNSNYLNFSPRIGIAWKVPYFKKSTVVRSGYGIYYNSQIYNAFASKLAEQPPFAISENVNTSSANPLTIADGFISVTPNDVTNTYAVDKNYRIPYAQTWNLAIQRDLWRGIFTEIGYLGTKGTHLDDQIEPNDNPTANLTAAQRQQVGSATGFIYDQSNASSIYNALQVRVQQRFRRGVSWTAYYVFSHALDDSSTIGGAGITVAQNWLDVAAERGLSSFNRTHVLTGNFVFTSPIGATGSRFASNSRIARLLKDWQLTGSITAESGIPLTARILGNNSALATTGGTGYLRANATGLPVTCSGSQVTCAGAGDFNLQAFIAPEAGEFGNAGRNTIPGPSLFALNTGFGRSFQLDESRRRLEVRFEGTNVLNTVSITGVQTVVNAINYGAPTTASGMRTIQLVVRFRF